jgi:hypothetical protein
MSSLITNPSSRATTGRRAQIVAEAVVSAYIREITPSRRPPARSEVRQTCPPSLRAGRPPLSARARTRQHAPGRRAALGARVPV